MRVLVTGATGFLGSWVSREFARAGHTVRVLVRDPARLGDLAAEGFEVARGDVLSVESLAEAVEGADAIAHCAGLVSLRPRDREAMHRVNVDGARLVFEVAASRGIRVLYTSSTATIGPMNAPVVLDEEAAPLPLDFDYPYATSKRKGESLASDYHRRGVDIVVLNPGILLGPGDIKGTSTQFVLRYLRGEVWMHLGGGASFGDVRDAAAAYVGALTHGRAGERYILAGANRRYRELHEDLRRLTGLHLSTELPQQMAEWLGFWSQSASAWWAHPFEEFNVPVVKWASLFNYCSARKATTELGYRTRDFTETLVDTIVDHIGRGAAQPRTAQLINLSRRG